MRDPYKILGVSETATAAEIKAAYRRLALAYHPDRNPASDAHETFKLVSEAFAVLSDPDQRRSIDAARGLRKNGHVRTDSARPAAASRSRRPSRPVPRSAARRALALPAVFAPFLIADLLISIAFFFLVMETLAPFAELAAELRARVPVPSPASPNWMSEFAAAAIGQAGLSAIVVVFQRRRGTLSWLLVGKILVIVGLFSGVIGLATVHGPLAVPTLVLVWNVLLFTGMTLYKLEQDMLGWAGFRGA